MSNASDFVVENGVLAKYSGAGGEVVIPNDVTSIKMCAFKDCQSITSVTIPSNVRKIDESAFQGCSCLEAVVVSEGVEEIRVNAFSGCEKLRSVTLPKRAMCIDSLTFNFLKFITRPENTVFIDSNAFRGCSSLFDKNGLMIIDGVLYECISKAGHIIIPDGTTHITGWTLCNCGMVTLPATVRKVDEGAFGYSNKLRKAIVPNELVVSSDVFPKETKIVVAQPDIFFKTADERSVAFVDDSMVMTADDIAYAWLFQSGKEWRDLLKKRTKNPAEVLNAFVKIYNNEPTLPAPKPKAIIDFISLYADELDAPAIRTFLKSFGETWPNVVKKIEANKTLRVFFESKNIN